LAVALAHTWFIRTGNKIQDAKVATGAPQVASDVMEQNEQKRIDDVLQWSSLPTSFAQALESTEWAGRGQVLTLNGRSDITMYLDGAHTPESIAVCVEWFRSETAGAAAVPPPQPPSSSGPLPNAKRIQKVLVFNCGASKRPTALFEVLSKFPFDHAFFTTNETLMPTLLEDRRPSRASSTSSTSSSASGSSTAQSWQEVLQDTWLSLQPATASTQLASHLPSLLKKLNAYADEHQCELQVLVTGSLYLVGAMLQLLQPEMNDKL
jgi:folylpolyglutamate synthase